MSLLCRAMLCDETVPSPRLVAALISREVHEHEQRAFIYVDGTRFSRMIGPRGAHVALVKRDKEAALEKGDLISFSSHVGMPFFSSISTLAGSTR